MSDYKITYSAELMQNYLQAEIMKPEGDFQAIQTADGNALLLSIGTDNALYATVETPGTRQGWTRVNLSTAQSGATCKAFAVAQRTNGSIHLAMVLSDSQGNDSLYLSLGNSDADTAWINNPGWIAYPYDDAKHARPKVQIADVFLSEASDGEYVVVDVLRDPGSTKGLIFRYFIDSERTGGQAWNPHDVAIDIEADQQKSCLGRKGSDDVDGIYACGQINDSAQLIYAPLYNAFDPTLSPNPDRLRLPDDSMPDAIAACRHADNTSDLYASAGGTLYYFAADNQEDGATAVAVVQNDLFNGVRHLYAYEMGDGKVMVWGLNDNDQVFYTTCPQDQVTAGAWSLPVPILGGVEQVSPFVNSVYSANTFFAHTGENKLVKAVKSPDTTLWNFREITLPPPTTTMAAQAFNSYTTRIQVNDAADQPVVVKPGTHDPFSVTLSASNVTSVYINHIYYVLGPTPITVNLDQLGSLTVVEGVHTVAGTLLTVGVDGAKLTINPMEKAFNKAASLTTPGALKSATVPNRDGSPSDKPLVPPGASDDALNSVAQGNQQLAKAYTRVATPAGNNTRQSRVTPLTAIATGPAAAMVAPADIGAILIEAGDLFAWVGQEIERGVEEAVTWVETTFDELGREISHFFAKIGEAIYAAVLDAVEKVVAAAQWLYNAVKTGIEDLIKYLEYLFDVEDMRRTKEVLRNVVKLYLYHQVDQIEVYRHKLDDLITGLETSLNTWAGVDWKTLGEDASAPVNSKSTPTSNQSAPGALIAHHFQGNVGDATYSNEPSGAEPDSNPINILFNAIIEEAHIVGDAFDRLYGLASKLTSMSLEAALKELVAILGDAVLESVKNIMDATLDVLYDIAKAVVGLLDTTIHIPVLSDILKDFGIPEFSLLDILCWVVAAPATIAYKIASGGQGPFPDDEDTKQLMSATNYQSLLDYFGTHQLGPSSEKAHRVFIAFHMIAGFAALPLAVLAAAEAIMTAENPLKKACSGLGIVRSVSRGFANYMEPYSALRDLKVGELGTAITGLSLLTTFVFSSGVLGKEVSSIKGSVPIGNINMKGINGATAIVNAIWVLPAIMIPVAHFIELGNQEAGPSRSIAIIDEVGVISGGLSTISYAVARNADPTTASVAALVMLVMGLCTSGMHFAEAGIAIAAGS